MGAKSARKRKKTSNGCGCLLLLLAMGPLLFAIFAGIIHPSFSIAASDLPVREAYLLQSAYATAQATPITASINSLVNSVVIVPVPLPTESPATATANHVANLRQGPGTDYAIRGAAQIGQSLTLVGRNAAGDWYQLDNGDWIAAFLVDNAPTGLPLVSN